MFPPDLQDLGLYVLNSIQVAAHTQVLVALWECAVTIAT